jgi:ELWxxDGT repeat protein
MRLDRTLLLASLFAGEAATVAFAQQPYLVVDPDPDTGPDSGTMGPLGALGDTFIFVARRNGTFDVWRTTGSPASTETFFQFPPTSANQGILAGADGVVLEQRLLFGLRPSFSFFPPATNALAGLWKTDGTTKGTEMVKAMAIDSNQMAVHDGRAFFGGDTRLVEIPDTEPWRTDGTPEGTYLHADVYPGSRGSVPSSFVTLPGGVLFRTSYDPVFPISGNLWHTDGTPGNARRLTTAHFCDRITRVGTRAFMTCGNNPTPERLWTTEGTVASTRQLKDIAAVDFVDVDGTAFFIGPDNGLWKSNGTEAGTVPVDVGPGGPFQVTHLVASNGLVYFVGLTLAHGFELWRSDGTTGGTILLRDIAPGPDHGLWPSLAEKVITAVPGGVVFTPDPPLSGLELWRSDGTPAGTVPFDEIEPGPSESEPRAIRAVGSRVYFTAFKTGVGRALWAVDLPAAVRIADATVVETSSGTADATFAVTLTGPAAAPVTVNYATVAGTATAGADFQARSGTISFPAGSAGPIDVTVPVVGDLHDEANETFQVELTGITGAVSADSKGLGIILDDDVATITTADVTVTEGHSGTSVAVFMLTLVTSDGLPAETDKVVRFATEAVTAGAGADFVPQAGVLTFASGTPSGTPAAVTVPIVGDTIDEPDESFRIHFEGLSDEVLPAASVTATIVDDDGVARPPAVELSHGTALRASLEPLPGRGGSQDWYLIHQAPHASYEVVVDEIAGDAVPLQLDRMAAGGSTALQTGTATGTGSSVSLRWQNFSANAVAEEHVRVSSSACGTCGADDTYRVRVYETTLAGARFNSSGGQVSVVILQNPTNAPILGYIRTWEPAGVLGQQTPFNIAAHGSFVFSPEQGTAGSLTITHDGPYGSLTGKAVALEPATGFSFDTPLTPRAR